jgi:ribose transport system permease protein
MMAMTADRPGASRPTNQQDPAAPASATCGAASQAPADARGAPAAPRGAQKRTLTAAYRLGRRAIVTSETWTLLALIILMAVFTALAPGAFLTVPNLSSVAKDAAPFLVMSVGETFVIVTAGIDLSVGAVLVLSGVVAGEYYQNQAGSGVNAGWGVILLGILFGLVAGGAFGAVQGVGVAKLKIPPLIATLAGLGVAEGIAYLVTGGSDLRIIPTRLANTIGLGSVAGVPWLIIISFAAAIAFGLILACTRFGAYTYAIGSNPEAARRAGIGVDRHLIKVYAISGLLSGVAGIISLAFYGTTTLAGHPTDNLTVITAVVLGGASLFGGRGSMFGTVIGVFIPVMLLNGLVILSVNQYWQYILIGVVLAAAVYLDQIRRRLQQRA